MQKWDDVAFASVWCVSDVTVAFAGIALCVIWTIEIEMEIEMKMKDA